MQSKDKKAIITIAGIAALAVAVGVGLALLVMTAIRTRIHQRIVVAEKTARDIETAIAATGRVMKVISVVSGRINIDDTSVTVLVCDAKSGSDGAIVQVRAYTSGPGRPVKISSSTLKGAHCSNP